MGAGTAMALLRGLHLAAMLSLLGTVGFVAWMLPAALSAPGLPAPGLPAPALSGPGLSAPDALRRRLGRLGWISLLVALLAGGGWFVLQSAAIADADTLSDAFDALPVVAAHTRYGTTVMVRLGLLLAAAAAAAVAWQGKTERPRRVALHLILLLAATALGLEGLIGHAGATGGAIGDGLVLSETLHLLAAGVWLGALLPLWLSLRVLPPAQAALVCERFSPIGLACVLVLAGTGFAQGLQLIGSVPALFGTAYGQIALLKIALFLLALVLAALNRLWLTDRLGLTDHLAEVAGTRRHLLVSVSVETAVGLAIVTAAAFMASSPPAAHTTPVWPFSWQFSLVTVDEDPDFRREVLVSLAAIGAAVALTAGALAARRFRLVALAVLVLAVVLRGPSFGLLVVEAYPTSFQTSPTLFSAVSIVRGQALFAQNCVACHGTESAGNGPAAASLHIRPADLTQSHIWEHSDGEMFWFLTHGMDDPEGGPEGSGPRGGLAMPGFGAKLSADDRWALIDYVRAHNAGLGTRRDGTFAVPVRAPAVALTCAGMTASTMEDLRGHVVHVVADSAARYEVPPLSGVSTIDLTLRDGAGTEQRDGAGTERRDGAGTERRDGAGTERRDGAGTEQRDGAGSEEAACVVADPAAWAAYAVLAGLSPATLAGTEFLIDPDGWLRAVQRPGPGGAWQSRDDLTAAIRHIVANPIHPISGGLHDHHH
jgi:putative copper export protein/mono/diheme cytochrome c family protein